MHLNIYKFELKLSEMVDINKICCLVHAKRHLDVTSNTISV